MFDCARVLKSQRECVIWDSIVISKAQLIVSVVKVQEAQPTETAAHDDRLVAGP